MTKTKMADFSPLSYTILAKWEEVEEMLDKKKKKKTKP
jgi:hypothetical protein